MKKENLKIIGLILLGISMLALMYNVENFTKFLTTSLGEKGTGNLLMGILGLMFLGMIAYIVYGFVRMVKSERKASRFRKVVNIADKVSVSVRDSFNAEVVAVDEEYVTISAKFRKGLIYPEYKKEETTI